MDRRRLSRYFARFPRAGSHVSLIFILAKASLDISRNLHRREGGRNVGARGGTTLGDSAVLAKTMDKVHRNMAHRRIIMGILM